MNHARLQLKKQMTAGKFIVGIDPAKRYHQATIIGSPAPRTERVIAGNP